ncbi:hypothetical protein CDCA_CDCA13G3689 [Cyanidium caldarium]|uniref:Cation/H+ exchanger transmembrane domain-containing protein n=1 Tax=Cyanidium caldarium TaxID=2771 RepID=A0AAV9J010_CYACA|nr:hypothetical protein CDCA_CDCA13G3689 [Cyanidium caldarium]
MALSGGLSSLPLSLTEWVGAAGSGLHAAVTPTPDPVGRKIFSVCHGFTSWTPSSYMILLFPLLSVLVAYLARHLFERYRIPLPYTFALVVIGGVLGVAGCYLNLAQLSASLRYWVDVSSPEILFYALLPPLIVEAALSIDWWTVSHLFPQVFALSMLLVIIDAALLATFTTYVFTDSPWSFNAGWMFGALISPTDVLAVIMALSGSGVRNPLKVMIEGESLFNDGSGFTLFLLFLNRLLPGGSNSIGEIFVQLAKLAGGGLALGIAFALPVLFFLRRVWKDAAIEIGAIFIAAYLVFYVAQGPAGVSGIVAVATLGLVFRADRFTAVTPELQESLESFWQVVSLIVNAIAFVYAGFVAVVNLIVFWGEHDIGGRTIGYGVALYPILYLSRLAAVVVLYPILRSSRYGLSWREALLIVHVGIRGAVSLIAAQIVFHEPDIQGGTYVNARVQLWTSTIVLLTLLFQGPTIKAFARWLGLLDSSAAQVRMFRSQVRRLRSKTLDILMDMRENSRFSYADWMFVAEVAVLPSEFRKLLLNVNQVRTMVQRTLRAQEQRSRGDEIPWQGYGDKALATPAASSSLSMSVGESRRSLEALGADARSSAESWRPPPTASSNAVPNGPPPSMRGSLDYWRPPPTAGATPGGPPPSMRRSLDYQRPPPPPTSDHGLHRSASERQLYLQAPRVSLAISRPSKDVHQAAPHPLQERHSKEMQRLHSRMQRARADAARSKRAGLFRYAAASLELPFGRGSIRERRRQHRRTARAATIFVRQLNESRRRALLAIQSSVQKQFLVGSIANSPYRLLSGAVDRSIDEVNVDGNLNPIQLFLYCQDSGWGLTRFEQWLVSLLGRFRLLQRLARYIIYRRLYVGYDVVSGLTVALLHALSSRKEHNDLAAADELQRGSTDSTRAPSAAEAHADKKSQLDSNTSLALVADMQVNVELEAEVARCETYLHSSRVLSPETVRASDSLHAASVLLSRQIRILEDMYGGGALTQPEHRALLDQVEMRREALQGARLRFPLPSFSDSLRSAIRGWLLSEVTDEQLVNALAEQFLSSVRAVGSTRAFMFGETAQQRGLPTEGVFFVVRGVIEARVPRVELQQIVVDAGRDGMQYDARVRERHPTTAEAAEAAAAVGRAERRRTRRDLSKTARHTAMERQKRQSTMIAELLSADDTAPGLSLLSSGGGATSASASMQRTAATASSRRTVRASAHPSKTAAEGGLPERAQRRAALARMRSFVANVFASADGDADEDDEDEALEWHAGRPTERSRTGYESETSDSGASSDLEAQRPGGRTAAATPGRTADDVRPAEPADDIDGAAAGNSVRTLWNSVQGSTYGLCGALFKQNSPLELVVVSQLAHVFFVPATAYRTLMSGDDAWRRRATYIAATECVRNLVPSVDEYLTETLMQRTVPGQALDGERGAESSSGGTDRESSAAAAVEEAGPNLPGVQADSTVAEGAPVPPAPAAVLPNEMAAAAAADGAGYARLREREKTFGMYRTYPSLVAPDILFSPEALEYEQRRDAMLFSLRTAVLVVWAVPRLRPPILVGTSATACIARRLRPCVLVLLQGVLELRTGDAEAALQLQHSRPLCKRRGCLRAEADEADAVGTDAPVRCRVLTVTTEDTPYFFHHPRVGAGAPTVSSVAPLHPLDPGVNVDASSGETVRRVAAPALIRVDVASGGRGRSHRSVRLPETSWAGDEETVHGRGLSSGADEAHRWMERPESGVEYVSDWQRLRESSAFGAAAGGSAARRVPSPIDLYNGLAEARTAGASMRKLSTAGAGQYTVLWFDPRDARLRDLLSSFGGGVAGLHDPFYEGGARRAGSGKEGAVASPLIPSPAPSPSPQPPPPLAPAEAGHAAEVSTTTAPAPGVTPDGVGGTQPAPPVPDTVAPVDADLPVERAVSGPTGIQPTSARWSARLRASRRGGGGGGGGGRASEGTSSGTDSDEDAQLMQDHHLL